MDTLTITRNLRDATLIFSGGSAVTFTLALDEGDFESTETPITPISVLDRGVLDHARTGDETPVTFSLSGKFTQYFGAGAASGVVTLGELAKKGGPAAELSWSSLGTVGEPFMFTLTLIIVNPGTSLTELLAYTRCVATSFVFAEGDEFNTVRLECMSFKTEPTVSSSSF